MWKGDLDKVRPFFIIKGNKIANISTIFLHVMCTYLGDSSRKELIRNCNTQSNGVTKNRYRQLSGVAKGKASKLLTKMPITKAN